MTESGGFVGVPLRYEVEVASLGEAALSRLKHAMDMPVVADRMTSAGGLSIRIELDDGNAKELIVSNATGASELAELAHTLRAHAKLLPA